MATFTVLIGSEKKDKTFPVMIQIYHGGEKKYLSTGDCVGKRDLAKGRLKDTKLIKKYNDKIIEYQDKIKPLHVNDYTAEQLKNILLQKEVNIEIDFISFGKNFIETQKESTGRNTETALKALTDFLEYDSISISLINLKMLQNFEIYLRETRKTGNSGINGYMSKIKQIFLAAREKYNDEETGKLVIKHNPFVKYKIPKVSVAKKRNLKPDIIKVIRDAPRIGKVAEIAKDIFMLSFYLVGMNTIDLYNVTEFKDGRLNYNRTKTKHRTDKAFISIKVEPEAIPLLEKYKDQTGKRVFNFYQRYKSPKVFSMSMAIGLGKICKKKEISEKITVYYARHSWATIARNICRISKDDVHFALNHSDPDMKVTDLYIEEDYSIIDEANRKVLDTLI